MPTDKNAIDALLQLEKRRPPEPFRDLPRRPNNSRSRPEYHAWEKALVQHNHELAAWYREHLTLDAAAPEGLRLLFAGLPVAGSQLRQLPDGSVQLDRAYARVLYPQHKEPIPGWTRPLEAPGPRRNADAFLLDNARRMDMSRRWDFSEALRRTGRRFVGPGEALPGLNLSAVQSQLHELTRKYVQILAARLDPARFRLLSKLQGGASSRPWSLLDYNLAVHSGPALIEAAAEHPGAVACWLYRWCENLWYPLPYGGGIMSRYRQDDSCVPPEFPRSAEQILDQVRESFQEASAPGLILRTQGGWQALAQQPPAHLRALLRRTPDRDQDPRYTADSWASLRWLMERLEQALPPANPPAPAAAAPQANTEEEPATPSGSAPSGRECNGSQICLLPETDSAGSPTAAAPATQPAKPAAKFPAKAAPPPATPSLELKTLLLDLRFARHAPGHRREMSRKAMGMPPQSPMAQPPSGGWDLPAKDQALDHLTLLAFRQYAAEQYLPKSLQLKRLETELEDLADFCWAQPYSVLRCRTYSELEPAHEAWRRR